jgi:ribonuclease P protein component
MTPDAPVATNAVAPPGRLRRRSEFLRAAQSGEQHHARAFKAQMAARPKEEPGPARFGFTVTKKVAGAVGRNRIRRRLREAARLAGALAAGEGRDYVFVARAPALTAPFSELCAQMTEAIARLNARSGARKPRDPSKPRNTKDRPGAP